jgi:hypothetical protein
MTGGRYSPIGCISDFSVDEPGIKLSLAGTHCLPVNLSVALTARLPAATP